MNRIIELYDAIFNMINTLLGNWFIPTLMRFTFAATLLLYFWNSAKTKTGDGILGLLSPSDNAYIQIFPKAFEAAGYDSSSMGAIHWLIAVMGTTAEFVLPAMIVLGLLTRLAAFGMIGFVFVQSFVDVTGHGVSGKDLGAWFDGASGSLIMDQRLFWVSILVVLIIQGAGPLSLDKLLKRT